MFVGVSGGLQYNSVLGGEAQKKVFTKCDNLAKLTLHITLSGGCGHKLSKILCVTYIISKGHRAIVSKASFRRFEVGRDFQSLANSLAKAQETLSGSRVAVTISDKR